MSSFDEVRLPPEIARGGKIGPKYNTIIISPSATEQRVSLWSVGRLSGEISFTTQKMDELAVLDAFFRARKGRGRGFRFRDLTDYQVTHEPLVNNGTTILQLIKTYLSGGQAEVRTIVKPSQVTLYKNGFPLTPGTDYTIDFTTGIITLTTATVGTQFDWSGEFDVPVRFDVDLMQYEHLQVTYGQWINIPIIELMPDWFTSGSESSSGGGTEAPLTPGLITITRGTGNNANLSAQPATGGSGTYTYQWDRSINGGAYAALSGATGLTYSDTGLSAGQSASYQLLVSDGSTSATSPQQAASWTVPQNADFTAVAMN